MCGDVYGHDWLQTCRNKAKELKWLFAEVSEKSVVGFWSYKKCSFEYTPISEAFSYLQENTRK